MHLPKKKMKMHWLAALKRKPKELLSWIKTCIRMWTGKLTAGTETAAIRITVVQAKGIKESLMFCKVQVLESFWVLICNYSDALVEFVKQGEGKSLTPYNNGIDYYLRPDIKINWNTDGSITEQEAERLLRIILDESKEQANSYGN